MQNQTNMVTDDCQSSIARLIKERLSWQQDPAEACETACVVDGFRKLLNEKKATLAGDRIDSMRTLEKIKERAVLEQIWKDQVNKTSLFGGKARTTSLSVSDVQFTKQH